MLSAALFAIALQTPNPSLVPAHRIAEGWWKAQHEAAVQLTAQGPLDVAFLGDSITQGWRDGGREVWQREWSGLKVGNFGFSGDRTEHVLWRLANGELVATNPKVVVLMIGTNNVGHGTANATQTAEGVRKVVQTLRDALPKSKILLLGIFPRGATANDPMRVAVAEATAGFKGIANGRQVRFLDLGSHFVKPDGALRMEIMPDALHLNPMGYDLWARALREPLNDLLGVRGERLKAGKWQTLFDGKSLDGWTVRGGTATYRIEDGAIVGRTADGSPNTFLFSPKTYGDFELEFETKDDDRLNSGVQIRSVATGEGRGQVSGPQIEVEASPGQAGYVYGEGTEFGWLSPEPELGSGVLNQHFVFRNGEWNSYKVVAQGPRIRTWLNGVPVADVAHEGIFKTHSRGYLGLQVHGVARGEDYQVSWRNLRIRELR